MDPQLYMESADDWETEVIDEKKDTPLEVKDRGYGKPTTISEVYPLTMEDSTKFGSQL